EIAWGPTKFASELPPGPGVGDSVRIIVRPERIGIRQTTASGNDYVSGVIEDRIYLGEQIKYLVRSDFGATLIAKEPSRTGAINARRGDRVALFWESSDCRFVPSTVTTP